MHPSETCLDPPLIQNLCILHWHQFKFCMHHCTTGCCNYFLIVNCTWKFENLEIVMKFIETWWKWQSAALFLKKLGSEFWKCIILIFRLAHDFTHLAFERLFLCATCLDSEPLHFTSKSVEHLHALLYHWTLQNKRTLDLSRYMEDTSCL